MLENLITFIAEHNGVIDKIRLAILVQKQFDCEKSRSVYWNKDFAIRFCKTMSENPSNTVLSLSALRKYDDKPFVVCIVTPTKNILLLANSTFLKKISHSSKELSENNIKGSFNGSDIVRTVDETPNSPEHFDSLFSIHQNISFQENLKRLVQATSDIEASGEKYTITDGSEEHNNIKDSVKRAEDFSKSEDYKTLLQELNNLTNKYKNEILIAALIDNVNLRGRIIEYIISGDDKTIQQNLIRALNENKALPQIKTFDGLGDYHKEFGLYNTETDIKTKIMITTSAPKGYNLDKILQFLSKPKTVFMIYFIGIDYEQRDIKTKLVSMFHKSLIEGTIIQTHWSGRNSRGTAQFNGEKIKHIILNETNGIDANIAGQFIEKILKL